MEKPKKECPNCQGAGEARQAWNSTTNRFEVAGAQPCRICYSDFNDVRKFTEEFLLEYSGKQSLDVSADDQDLCFIGEDGQKYRRLLTWLWTHPPDIGQDRNGFPRGSKPTKSKTFAQLFGHESKRKPRIPKMESEGTCIKPLFAADVRPLLESWTKIIKPIRKNCRIPALHYVKVSPHLDGITLECTDLKDWIEGYCPACTFDQRPFLLPGAIIQKILKVCNKKGVIAFGLDPDDECPMAIIARHENSTWKIPVLCMSDYPVRTWPEVEEEREVA